VIAFATVFLILIGSFAMIPASAGASAAGGVSTIDELNLRAEPALNAEILNVMPTGAGVEIIGDPANGFYPVAYQGQTGWAYSAYLTTGFVGEGPVTTGGQQGEVYVADGPVNFRTGPSTDDGIISVIPDGALVALNGDSANGFVSIIYTDQSGWAHAGSIFGTGEDVPAPAAPAAPEAPAEPVVPHSVPVGDVVTGTATVVDGALNLRTGPGTNYAVVLVMPGAASVELRGDAQANFFPISYNGTLGWASADFLQQGAVETPPEPTAPPAPAPSEPEAPAPAEPETPAAPTPAPTEPAAPAPTPVPTTPPTPETPAAPPVDGSDDYTEDEIIQIIYAAADAYGQPREDMLRVARCESLLDPSAVNSTSQASGLFQFLPATWQRTPFADQDVFDPVANANATAWMWQQGNRGEWTCQ
jgi:uncharacterized protein YraI